MPGPPRRSRPRPFPLSPVVGTVQRPDRYARTGSGMTGVKKRLPAPAPNHPPDRARPSSTFVVGVVHSACSMGRALAVPRQGHPSTKGSRAALRVESSRPRLVPNTECHSATPGPAGGHHHPTEGTGPAPRRGPGRPTGTYCKRRVPGGHSETTPYQHEHDRRSSNTLGYKRFGDAECKVPPGAIARLHKGAVVSPRVLVYGRLAGKLARRGCLQ